MRKLSNKAQFFILTTVIIIGVFFTLSKYVNQHSFIDTSAAAKGAEIFMFENIKEKAIKTVQISNVTNFKPRLLEYKISVENMVADRGYTIVFDYVNVTDVDDNNVVYFNMTLMSEKYILKSGFSQRAPLTECDRLCVMEDYDEGVCEQNPVGQCEQKVPPGDYYGPEGDVYCTGGEDEDTCCCFPSTD